MMRNHKKPATAVDPSKKTASLAATVFFALSASTLAQFNISDGVVYGNSNVVATQSFILSGQAGTNNLDVLYAGTDTIQLQHDVTGYIRVSNAFDSMTITATGGTLSNAGGPALAIHGGTNLSITAGLFAGLDSIAESNAWNASLGGLIDGVQTALVINAEFTGGLVAETNLNVTYPPIPGESSGDVTLAFGADGLHVTNSHVQLISAKVAGGAGGETRAFNDDLNAAGGHALVMVDASGLISNGVFQGGSGGAAEGTSSYRIIANGGHGAYVSASDLTINGGTFTGGAAGTISGGGTNIAVGGRGLQIANGSSVTIDGGVFVGSSGAAAVGLIDSDLTILDASLVNGGFLGETSVNGTNHLVFLGGNYASLTFLNGTNGVQHLTSSNLTVAGEITQQGGLVAIDNLDDTGFSAISVSAGTMRFSNEFTLGTGGSLTLNGEDARGEFLGNLNISGTADIGLGRLESAGAVEVRDGGTLRFDIITNNFGVIDANAMNFATNSALVVDASLAGLSTGETTIAIITTGAGVSGYDTNTVDTRIIVSQNTNVTSRTQLSDFGVSGNDFVLVFNTDTLSNYWGATGQLAILANELDGINHPTMNAIINNLGSAASKKAAEDTYFTTLNTMRTALYGLDAAVGLAASRGTEFREQRNLPRPLGANGPGAPANDWRFWGKYYGQFHSKDAEGANSAYDATMHGGAIGLDRTFGPILVGLSGGMGRYDIESENRAEQDINAGHVALYSTIGEEHAYLEGGLAYGHNKVESRTGGPFILEGDFDAQLISGYLGGGWGFPAGKSLVLTPEASARYTLYQQDAYTETSTTAVPRSFDKFDADSLRGSLGLNVAMRENIKKKNFGYKVEARGHWLREFNPDPGNITFQLQGGSGNDYVLAYPLLDEDALRLGFGVTFFNTAKDSSKNVLLRLDFDELIGENFNSHNLAAKVIYAF